jgi:crotonobetainyl-CoA:carnitine CoA-transferase CaiB-like acyl-CoA transferase
MNDVPDTTFEVTKLSPKKTSYAPLSSAGLSALVPCAEGEQLKQQYDATLEEWRKQSQPPARRFAEAGVLAQRALQLKEALTERNAAANRMYLHRAGCAICRRRR